MADRPILFSGPMVRAQLEGRKTQTRRAMRVQPLPPVARWVLSDHWWVPKGVSDVVQQQFVTTWPNAVRCPYGRPGDLLWVRESWQAFFDDEVAAGRQRGPRHTLGIPAQPNRKSFVFYGADGELISPEFGVARWRPPIHMPRAFSRLTLRITDVRVERLTAISDDDIWAEGVQVPPPCSGPIVRSAFAVLWDSINGAGSFDANPWVWALTFEVIPRNINDVLLELANAPEPAR